MKSTQITALLLTVAVLASVVWGVPLLLRRAHAEEALTHLARLTRVSDVYYVKPRPGADGERMICQFPTGEIRSSLAKSCCDPSVGLGDGRCDPQKILWNRSMWKSLRFTIDEPHWFIYELKATGTLGDARLEVSAYGDADCDGEYSTFRFVQKGGAASTRTNCVLPDPASYEAIQPDE